MELVHEHKKEHRGFSISQYLTEHVLKDLKERKG